MRGSLTKSTSPSRQLEPRSEVSQIKSDAQQK